MDDGVWRAADSEALYRMAQWGEGYFTVNDRGEVAVRPDAQAPPISLLDVAARVERIGLRLPVLLRFPALLGRRANYLCDAFDRARDACGYSAPYTLVYPVKVNQQRTVVEHLLAGGDQRLGLEAGSKPELMAVLGAAPAGRTIVCNGYKDRAFIRLGLIGSRLGHRVFLVIEKLSEVQDIDSVAREEGVAPRLGLRVRLASVAAGHWQNTGGEKAKFGLTAAQAIQAIDQLKASGQLEHLRMLHVHIGSQVADSAALQRAMAEVGSLYAALRDEGAPIECVDVGGGLAVDYEGRRATSFCSMNYAVDDYARIVVQALAGSAARSGHPQPEIISESGRALTAHHAVLLTEVIDTEQAGQASAALPVAEGAADELNDAARDSLAQTLADFVDGRIGLAERARREQSATDTLRALEARLTAADALGREIHERLADKYFCNFSVFQSVPDVWALDQVFPVMPIERLNERPTRRTRLCDLTCDSDGRMDRYVDDAGLDSTLPLHDWDGQSRYRLAIFLVGAYQENLGDMHNLFGDTDAVNVEIGEDGSWQLAEPERGDSADELLRYVHFDPDRLRAAYARKLDRSGLDDAQASRYMRLLEEGLGGYTYLLD
ncbi:MAG: arginine decarboxylase [Salinisphaeraceae bacterium]|nr:arginine decarboxylase [Salinisphaeraceae bacterium]